MQSKYFGIKLLSIGLISILLLTACSSKNIEVPISLIDLDPTAKQNEQATRIYQDLKLQNNFICRPGTVSCPDHRNEKEVVILFTEEGVDLEGSLQKISCGIGSPDGVWSLFEMNGGELLYYNDRLCSTAYYDTSVIGTVLNQGVFLLYTLGTYVFTGGLTYRVKTFNEDFFLKKASSIKNIINSDLPQGWFAVVDIDDIESAKKITPQRIDGIVFTSQNDYIAYLPTHSRSKVLSIILDGIEQARQKKQEYFYIKTKKKMPEPPTPKLPEIVDTLVKTEFETLEQFNIRVQLQEKQNRKKSLQSMEAYKKQYRTYAKKIKQLEIKYRETAHSIDEYYDKLRDNILKEQKQIVVETLRITQGYYQVRDLRYDAQTERLHVKIFLNGAEEGARGFFNIDKVPASELKGKKDLRAYAKYEVNNNNIYLSAIHLDVNGKKYPITYTSEYYKPELAQAHLQRNSRISTNKPKEIVKIEAEDINSSAAQSYWQIDIVKRTNGKVPEWFNIPEIDCGYGTGETLLDARAMALSQLAQEKSATVHVMSHYKKTYDGGQLRAIGDEDIKVISVAEKIKTSTLKQERSDGIWYVALKKTP
jgi:hypothetical protein